MVKNVLINKGARGAEALANKGARGAEALANKGARGAEALVKGVRGAEALALKSLAMKSLAVIENCDGIRKDNARVIFGILLIIIVVDFGMEMFN